MNRRFVLPLLGCCLVLTGCGQTRVAAPVVEAAEAALPAVAGDPFEFPKDASGALLGRTLVPAEPKRLLDEPVAPLKPFAGPDNLEGPGAPIEAGKALVPSVPPQAIVHDLKPHLVSDEAVFNPREELSLPQAVFFPVPNPARLVSRDVNKPVPVPPLARQAPDQAPLEDPTREGSEIAANNTPPPERTKRVPYAKVRVAESYEDRALRLAMPPPENGNPASRATPRTPGK